MMNRDHIRNTLESKMRKLQLDVKWYNFEDHSVALAISTILLQQCK